MATKCLILRTNRTMSIKMVKDKCDDFDFEGGTYFIRKHKVFLWKSKGLRGKITPTLMYVEGIADPLYLDNMKFKQYKELVPLLDENKKPIIDEKTGEPKTVLKSVRKLEDIFIDARAIHNMTDDKILIDLSAQEEVKTTEIIILILLVVSIAIGILSIIIH